MIYAPLLDRLIIKYIQNTYNHRNVADHTVGKYLYYKTMINTCKR